MHGATRRIRYGSELDQQAAVAGAYRRLGRDRLQRERDRAHRYGCSERNRRKHREQGGKCRRVDGGRTIRTAMLGTQARVRQRLAGLVLAVGTVAHCKRGSLGRRCFEPAVMCGDSKVLKRQAQQQQPRNSAQPLPGQFHCTHWFSICSIFPRLRSRHAARTHGIACRVRIGRQTPALVGNCVIRMKK